MGNAYLEVLHVGTESASAMGTGTIEDVEIPVSPNGNPVKTLVLLVTTSVNTPIDM